MLKLIRTLPMMALIVVGGFAGYKWAESRVAEDVYKRRMMELYADYAAVRKTYNSAVAKSAVTELVVDPDTGVKVWIRDIEGVKEFPTPFTMGDEIYVEFFITEGRTIIRRVFTDSVSPNDGTIIDSKLMDIDFEEGGKMYCTTVSRRFTPGRWAITMTENGALNFRTVEGSVSPEDYLNKPPTVKEFEVMTEEIEKQLDEIDPMEVLNFTIN